MIRKLFPAAALLFGLAALAPASTPSLSPKEQDEVLRLVSVLRHPSFKVREDASNVSAVWPGGRAGAALGLTSFGAGSPTTGASGSSRWR